MIVDVKAPRGGCLTRKVRRLVLTADTEEDQIRLRNMLLALEGKIQFCYLIDGEQADEDAVCQYAGDTED